MGRIQILTIIFILLVGNATGQILRYRLSGNSGWLLNETGPSEIRHPEAELLEFPSATDFSPSLKLGADFEVTAPIVDQFELGVEFEYGNLAGRTETPKLYNFFLFDWVNPLPDDNVYPDAAIIYETTQLSILGTATYYFLPSREQFNIFIKAYGGISYVGTDLKFHDPYYRVTYDIGVLYAKGTLNSEEPKDRVFCGGGGIGGTYKLTERMAIYLEASGSYVNSDLINGVPNYDYIGNGGVDFRRSEGVGSVVGQLSLGLIYSAIPDSRLNKGNYTKSHRVTKKKTWKRKRRPFGRRKRR